MGFLICHPGVCVFGAHTTGCLETYCQWACFWVPHRSVLPKVALGQAGDSEHWDGAAQGLAGRRTPSLHSPGEGTRFPHVFVEGIAPGTGMEPVSHVCSLRWVCGGKAEVLSPPGGGLTWDEPPCSPVGWGYFWFPS